MAQDKDEKVKVKEKTKSPSQLEGAFKSKTTWLVGIGLLVMIGAIMWSMPKEKKEENPVSTFNLSAGSIGEQNWQVKAQAKLADVVDSANDARKQAKDARRRAQKTQEKVGQLSDQMRQMENMLRRMGEFTDKRLKDNADAREELRKSLRSDMAETATTEDGDSRDYEKPPLETDKNPLPPPPPTPGGPHPANQQLLPPIESPDGVQDYSAAGDDKQPIVFTPPALAGNADQGTDDPKGTSSQTQYMENQYAGYLPSGSFAPVALLSGLDAAASAQTRANPQPVLMRVQRNATTPGDSSYAMQTCSLIGSAYGDMSSERAYVRLTRLSCVDPVTHDVIESDISGYVTDSDGFLGLRGKLVRRNGQLLAKAILSGFASSIASVARSVSRTNAQTITSAGSALGAQRSSVNIDAGELAQAGAYGGAADAADMIAKYYLEQAQAIFPVISIPPGRKATVVITEGTTLKWHDTTGQYVKNITPNG